MGWDNAGGYNRQHNFSADASANIKILASRMDAELDDVASAMTIAWARNGQNVPTQDIPMGGRKFVNVGAAASVNNFMRVREFIENVPIFMQDQESSADRISVSAQYFTSVSSNQAPGDGTRIFVRANSNKSSAALYLNGHSANVEYQGGSRIGAALASGGVYELIYSSTDTAWKVQNPDFARTSAETAAGISPPNIHIPPRTKPPGSIERFLTAAAGNDITTALADAMSVSSQNRQDIIIPTGDWVISGECGFPDLYSIQGQGRFSRLLLDLTAGQWAFKYSTNGGSINSWGFKNLYFGIVSGGEENVGAIAMTDGQTLRGAYIEDIWADELQRIIRMQDVFGELRLRNISCKLSSGEADVGNAAIDLAQSAANAIRADNIELLGLYRTGIKFTGNSFKLKGFNIAGSVTTTSELETAIHLVDAFNFSIQDGYIEKMKNAASSYQGFATGNGSAKSIIVEGTGALYETAGEIGNINMATGSLYVHGATVDITGPIRFSEANGGIRSGSGTSGSSTGLVRTRKAWTKSQPNSTGLIELIDGNNSGRGYEPNPELGTWGTAPFANISGGSQSNETSDFLSGDRSIKITCASQFDGVTYTVTLPKASIECTVVAKVKAQTTSADVRMDVTGDTSQAAGGVNRYRTNTVDEWQLLAITCSSSTTSVQVRIRNGLNGAATFLIDAVNCFPGKSSYDPSYCVTPAGSSAYSPSNVTTDRAFDADTAADAEISDVLGTLIADLKTGKPIR